MTALGLLGAIGIALLISALLYGPILLYFFYIPKTNKLRVSQRGVGKYTYFRSEFYRPIFGWSGFNASKYNGSVWLYSSWTNDKNDCEQNIEIYKNLKNIK